MCGSIADATPAIPEQPGGEKKAAGDGRVEAGLGDRPTGDLAIPTSGSKIDHVLQRIENGANHCADRDRELNKTGGESVPPIVVTESLGDAREEEEQDTPCEADPESEKCDDRLGEKHSGGSLKRDLQEFPNTRGVQIRLGVYRSPSLLANLFGAFFEYHVCAGLAENEPKYRYQCCVVDDLDVENPTRYQPPELPPDSI